VFRFVVGIFLMLHGLVHIWYVVLSQRLVEFRPEMGWTGESWLLTPLIGDSATRALATALYLLATLGFVAGAVGVFSGQAWWRQVTIAAAAFSAVVILLFWDGGMQMLMQRGLLGLLIDVAIFVSLAVFDWPSLGS
jgi:hypothetical protein